MQTNTDKTRTFRNDDKEPRRDPKRDKMNPKFLRKLDRRIKHSSRESDD